MWLCNDRGKIPRPSAEAELDLAPEAPADRVGFSKAAVRFSETLLAKLRALTPPEADRDQIDPIYLVVEEEIDLERRAAAASAGNTARVLMLTEERVGLTHSRDSMAGAFGFQECPLGLPA